MKQNPGRIPNGRGGSGVHGETMVDRDSRVKLFSYTNEILDELETSLSPERLRTYLQAARGNRQEAIRLHVRNTALSAAFYGPLQGLEVALRNALHKQLVTRYGPSWYDNLEAGLDRGALERVRAARSELGRGRHGDSSSPMVATLSFGFWISLLGPGGRTAAGRKANYEMTLWRPSLRAAFAHRATLTRRQVHRPLNDLRTLRNRIAHHEPILGRNLAEDHDRILEVCGWISPATRAWIEHHSEVVAVIEAETGV